LSTLWWPRKNWGGNRTQNGARAQAVLTSILETARQQRKNPLEVLIALLVGNAQAKILDLVALYAVPKAVDGTRVSVQP